MTKGEIYLSEGYIAKLQERGAKSKMKASGQFWNEESASWYATINLFY